MKELSLRNIVGGPYLPLRERSIPDHDRRPSLAKHILYCAATIEYVRYNYLSIGEAAGELGIVERTIYRYMELGYLHPVRIGKSWRFERSVLEVDRKCLHDK